MAGPGPEDDYYTQRWQQFQHLDRMRDHWWWRPGWHTGRSFYTWHITFENAPAVHQLAAAYQQHIALPTLDPVPAEGLHMTLQGIGFTDEVPAADLRTITAEASRRCAALPPFTLTLGPADGDPEGVPLAVHPWKPVQQLRHTLRQAIAAARGPDRVPEPADQFHPHLTLFYSNTTTDPAPLRALLTELHTTPPVTTTIDTVSLIQLNRDTKVYRWTTITALPLTGQTPEPPA